MGISLGALGLVSTIAGAAGAGVSAFGKYEEGQATKEAMAYRATVAANNAAIASRDARLDIQAGEVAATNKGLQTRAKVGSQLATQGASGVDVNSGSAPTVRAATAEYGMLDALTIRSNSEKQAYAKEVEATSDTAQSQLDTMAGEEAGKAGALGAAGTLLSGASTVGLNFARWQKEFG